MSSTRSTPRHTARSRAEQAWAKAVSFGNDPGKIIAGAKRYRDDPNREDEFTKHPSTWLNGACWDDDPLPARHRSRGDDDPMVGVWER